MLRQVHRHVVMVECKLTRETILQEWNNYKQLYSTPDELTRVINTLRDECGVINLILNFIGDGWLIKDISKGV